MEDRASVRRQAAARDIRRLRVAVERLARQPSDNPNYCLGVLVKCRQDLDHLTRRLLPAL